MITDENHPEMVAAHHEIVRRLGVLIGGGRRLDKYLLSQMFDVVKQHRQQCRLRGLDFPKLVCVIVPRLNIVEWSRADLDVASLRVKIVNFVRDHPNAQMTEVVSAFKAAWPHIKADDLAAPTDKIIEALAKKAGFPEKS